MSLLAVFFLTVQLMKEESRDRWDRRQDEHMGGGGRWGGGGGKKINEKP